LQARGAMSDIPGAAELQVERRCLVCDWTGTTRERGDTPEIGPLCPECHAPTERVRIERAWNHPPNPHAAWLGRLGGLKGGPARAASLSARRRREIARSAALARWRRRSS
jgi:hypothetical protein